MQHHSKETSASCVDIQALLSACFSAFLLAVMTSFNSRSLAAEKKKNIRLSRTFLDWILGPQGHAYTSICDHIADNPQGRDQAGPRASRYPFPRLEERTGQSMLRCLLFTGQLGERARLA